VSEAGYKIKRIYVLRLLYNQKRRCSKRCCVPGTQWDPMSENIAFGGSPLNARHTHSRSKQRRNRSEAGQKPGKRT
jgi:hypothetical protein